jgi:FixJ family two-component response regulator
MPFDAIGDELAGRVALPPELVVRLVEEFRDSSPRRRSVPSSSHPVQLTSREWEVLDLLRQGCGTGEIARRLFVSPTTVRSPRGRGAAEAAGRGPRRHRAAVRERLGRGRRRCASQRQLRLGRESW